LQSLTSETFDGPPGWQLLLRDAVALGWLWLATNAVFLLLVMGPSSSLSAEQEELLRLFVLPSLPLAAAVLVLRPRDIVATFLRLPFLTALLLLVWSSVAWSIDPAVSLRRAMLLTAYTVLAVWLCLVYTPAALLMRMAWLWFVMLVLSTAFAVLLPGLAFHMLDGEWVLRGVFAHKNVLGQHIGFAAILMVTAAHFDLLPRWATALGLVLCAALAVPAGSATALIIMAGLAVIWLITTILALPGRLAAMLLALAFSAACFLTLAAILGADAIFATLGRDPTLTGRLPLWDFVWLQITREPWLGYGFHVFFDLDWVQTYTVDALRWAIPNAHNGFLELWLGVGVAGPLLVTAFLLLGLGRAIGQLMRQKTPEALFAVYLVPIYLMRNIVESDLAAPSQISWPLVVIAVVMTLRPNEELAASKGEVADAAEWR
jgi:exopolysaccharide production protein ExoQ